MKNLTRFSPYRAPPEDSPEYLEWLAWRLEEREIEGAQIHPQTIPLLVSALRVHAGVRIRKGLQDAFTVRSFIGASPAEFLAYSVSATLARAAYEAAFAERPQRVITLQKGAHVIESSDRTKP